MTGVPAMLERAPDDVTLTFLRADGSKHVVTYAELRDQVARIAGGLHEEGIAKGHRVALLFDDPERLVPFLLAVLWTGATPHVLAPPGFTRPETYAGSTQRVVEQAGMQHVLVDEHLAAATDLGTARVVLAQYCESPWIQPVPRTLINDDDLAIIQATSGTTGVPRLLEVSAAQMRACERASAEAFGLGDHSVGVSWLPMHHDMGLVGMVFCALSIGGPVTYLAPQTFLHDPLLWLDAISDSRATISATPSFGSGYLLRRLRATTPRDWDLSSLTTLVVGGEPVHAPLQRALVAELSKHGLRDDVIAPSYGCAEATLTMTFSPPRPFLVDVVDPDALAEGRAEPAAQGREVVACGKAVPGSDLQVVDADGNPLPDRTIGEVLFRSPAVVGRYANDPDATATVFPDATTLRPGDLGYLVDGELFLTGRVKDVLILNGRNYDPQTVEWVVEQVEGVRRGCTAAFTVPGPETELLVIAAETRGEVTAEVITTAVTRELRLPVHDVHLLAPGELPKTTSGKVQRQAAAAAYLAASHSPRGPAKEAN